MGILANPLPGQIGLGRGSAGKPKARRVNAPGPDVRHFFVSLSGCLMFPCRAVPFPTIESSGFYQFPGRHGPRTTLKVAILTS